MNSDIEKAECFNTYLKSVFSPHALGSIPSVSDRIARTAMPEVIIGMDGIIALIRNLDTSKAYGPDELSSLIFHNCRKEFARYLHTIFTKSLTTGIIPDHRKKANGTKMFKSGSRNLVENYRPVYLTCVACKLLRHILYSSIYNLLSSSNFFFSLPTWFPPKLFVCNSAS